MFHMNTHTDTREPRCASEKLAICCHCQLPSSTKLKRTGCYIPSNGFCLSFFLYIGKKRNKVLSTFFSFVCHKAAIIQVPCTYRGQQKGIVLQRQQNWTDGLSHLFYKFPIFGSSLFTKKKKNLSPHSVSILTIYRNAFSGLHLILYKYIFRRKPSQRKGKEEELYRWERKPKQHSRNIKVCFLLLEF